MDSDTFQLFVTRFEAYVDRINQDSVDYDALVTSIVAKLNVTFNNIEPIDFENISPVVPPIQMGGHHLSFFKGDLRVPEIDKQHDTDVSKKTEQDEPGAPSLPVIPTKATRFNRYTSKPRGTKPRVSSRRTPGKTSSKGKSKRPTGSAKNNKPNAGKKVENKSKLRQAQDAKYNKRAKNNEWKRTKSSRSMPVELKNHMVKNYPDRFKITSDGKLIEKLSNGKTVVVTEAMVKKILINNPPPVYGKTLKTFTKALGAASVVFTAYDLYLLYNVFSDDNLSKNDKIEQSGPIIGQMLGGFGGAVAGALAGSAVLPGWGTFLGSVGGGVAGVFAGDALGEVVAGYIVGDEPPEHPSGKPWSELSNEEIQQWSTRTSIEKNKTYIDNTQTTQSVQTPLPTKNETPEYILEPVPMTQESINKNQQVENLLKTYIENKSQQNQKKQLILQEIETGG